MSAHWPPGSGEQSPSEFEGGVAPGRRLADDWASLGDGTPQDLLALRDHLIGLEAELHECRQRSDHYAAELGLLRARLSLRIADRAAAVAQNNIATRVVRGVERRAAILSSRRG